MKSTRESKGQNEGIRKRQSAEKQALRQRSKEIIRILKNVTALPSFML